MFVAGAAPKGSLFGTEKASGGNPEFVVGIGGSGPRETEVALEVGPKSKLALLLLIFGPVLSWVSSEAPEITILQIITLSPPEFMNHLFSDLKTAWPHLQG